MAWLQISFKASKQDCEPLEEGLEEFGACSVTLKDSEDQPILEPGPGETPLWDQVEVTALFDDDFDPSFLLAWMEQQGLDKSRITIETLQDENWQEKWMADFKPLCFGERLWVVPTWFEPPQPGAVNIMLDPGLAFGSGTHPTTALCLEWLDGHDLSGKTLIDYGCGSGILAIAAVKLGAKEVWALDNDPQALESCRQNADQNGVLDKIHIISPEEYPRQVKMDIVMANILVTPLIELRKRFLSLASTGGSIVMSGILESQVADIEAAWSADLDEMENKILGDWARVSGSVAGSR